MTSHDKPSKKERVKCMMKALQGCVLVSANGAKNCREGREKSSFVSQRVHKQLITVAYKAWS